MSKRKRKIRKVLITGIAGSGGSYLTEYIVQNHPEVEVFGMSRWHTNVVDNLNLVRDKIRLYETDLLDFSSILTVLRSVKPDAIFHLASHANVRTSFITPLAVLHNNVMGTANLFEAIKVSGLHPLIQLCSTSEVYGQVDPKRVPITEDTPMNPVNIYAVSKTAQDLLGLTYFKSYGMSIIRTRMFTYLNPRRADLFASAFARQVARIELGFQKKLLHGNLDSVRTMIDVRDATKAYWDAVLYCKPGEVYNIGGSTIMKVGEFLEKLIELSGMRIPCCLDTSLVRPVDVTLQIPSVEKFKKQTGWEPEVSFEDSMANLLQYWRERVKQEGK